MSQALSENVRTIRVGISGTSDTESYTLAPGLAQYVEAVYVEIDNGAASDVRPVLTISEQAGVPIAKRGQGGRITAGGTGSATWALRLSGDDAADTGLTGIYYDIENTGDWLWVDATSHRGGASDPNNDHSVVFQIPTPHTGGGFFVQDSAGNTILDAVSSDGTDFGVDITGGGNGSLSVAVPAEFHTIDGGTFRVSGSSLFDVSGDEATLIFSGDALLQSGGDLTLSGSGVVQVLAGGGTGINGAGLFVVDSTDPNSRATIDQNGTVIRLPNNALFSITDHLGNDILRLSNTAPYDLHLKTGATIIFDL